MLSGVGGTSKLYEAQEKAVLHEYQQVLQKLIDRASTKAEEHKQQQETPGQSVKRPTDSLSRPGSAPAGIGAAQQLAAGLATQGGLYHSAFGLITCTSLLGCTPDQPVLQARKRQTHQICELCDRAAMHNRHSYEGFTEQSLLCTLQAVAQQLCLIRQPSQASH